MKKVLLLILFLGFILRSYQVTTNPPAMSWDEVSIGYNAYSILKTGRDEHGTFFPFQAFVAYGDYKPPLSIYLTVPFVALFGLGELAVRLPSVLFGTLTILLTYLLVRELFRNSQFTIYYALLSSLLLAISPWHINVSRGGFEANIALFFAVLGVWMILRARSYPRYWYIAWLPFVAAIYTFNSSRVFAVFLAPALALFTYADIRKHWKQFAIGIGVAAIVMLPILPHLVSREARLRFTEVNIFTDLSVVENANTRIARDPSVLGNLVNNRRVGYARSFVLHFLDNLQPEFLFMKGDGNPKFSIQDVGQLYFIEAPFLVIGILAMLNASPGVALLLLYWIVAAILPAATARETPHALRILNSLPTWHIFIAYGIVQSVLFFKKIRIPYVLFLVALYIFSAVYYLHTYYRQYPFEYSGEWEYGYKQALEKIAPIQSTYDHIVMTDNIGRPYMYALFYTKTNPNDLFRTVKSYTDAAGFYHVDSFTKYEFPTKLPPSLDPKTIYIWSAGATPKGAHIVDTIKLLNGDPILTIFTI